MDALLSAARNYSQAWQPEHHKEALERAASKYGLDDLDTLLTAAVHLLNSLSHARWDVEVDANELGNRIDFIDIQALEDIAAEVSLLASDARQGRFVRSRRRVA